MVFRNCSLVCTRGVLGSQRAAGEANQGQGRRRRTAPSYRCYGTGVSAAGFAPTRRWFVRATFCFGKFAATDFGIFLTFVGAGIAIWARYCLGQYWSARVTLKIDHRLIRSGPYTYVRHPIYSGLLLAMAGTALVIGEWRALIAVLIAILEFSRKATKEEALLSTEFNDDYQEYRKHAGFLTPRFR